MNDGILKLDEICLEDYIGICIERMKIQCEMRKSYCETYPNRYTLNAAQHPI